MLSKITCRLDIFVGFGSSNRSKQQKILATKAMPWANLVKLD